MKKTANSKPTNPKDVIGVMKVPLHLNSPIAEALWSVAQYLGDVKYGQFNWRVHGATASVYIAALKRHTARWAAGEEFDSDGTHHLANAMACLAILMEAQYLDVLIDDRGPAVPLQPLYDQIEKVMMPQILAMYGDRKPRRYTIADDIRPDHVKKAARKSRKATKR